MERGDEHGRDVIHCPLARVTRTRAYGHAYDGLLL